MRGGLRHAAIRLMSSAPAPSSRIGSTDVPCIVQMQQMLRGKTDVLSLAQGIVHWPPPAAALDAARDAVGLPQTNAYCADDGLPELRDALKARLAAEKGLVASEVMVTAGANQGYTNLVLSLLDAGDTAVLFRPYYFNHLMALQMTGSEIVTPASTPDLQPDLAALEAEIAARAADGRRPIRMLTLVNPGNPTGVMIPQATVEAASALCAAHGIWLVMDNTYEHFAYDGRPPHACVEGDHVINVFSFSKAFGMMGWRVGYLAFPPALVGELFKAQDTIVICPTVVSQRAALGALGPRVHHRHATVVPARREHGTHNTAADAPPHALHDARVVPLEPPLDLSPALVVAPPRHARRRVLRPGEGQEIRGGVRATRVRGKHPGGGMRVDASGERRRGAGPRGRAAHVPQAQRAVHAPRREDRGEGGGRVVRGGNGGNAAAAGDEDRLRAPPAVRDPGHERGDPPRRTIIGVRTIGVGGVGGVGVGGGGRRGSERPHGDAAAVSAAAQQRRRAAPSRVRRRAFASSDESIVVVRVVRVEGVEPFLARGVVEDDVLDLLEPDEERPPRGGEARARARRKRRLSRG